MNDMLKVVVVKEVGQVYQIWGREVPGPLFADDFVGISATLEGLQKQIDAAMKCVKKWRLSANVG